MRIGGATSLACMNWSSEMIMILGRWSSDCYIRYLRVDDHKRRMVSSSMAKVTTEDVVTAIEQGAVPANGWAE